MDVACPILETSTYLASSLGCGLFIRLECGSAERHRWRSIDHELEIDAVIWELQKVEFLEPRLELSNKVGRVSNSEGNNRPGISQKFPNTHEMPQCTHIVIPGNK